MNRGFAPKYKKYDSMIKVKKYIKLNTNIQFQAQNIHIVALI